MSAAIPAINEFASSELEIAFEAFQANPSGPQWYALKIAMMRYQQVRQIALDQEGVWQQKLDGLLQTELGKGDSWSGLLRVFDSGEGQ